MGRATPPSEFHPTEEPVVGESTRQNSVAEEPGSAMGIAQRIYRLGNQPQLNRTTSAFPGGDPGHSNVRTRTDRAQRQPISTILRFPLPSLEVMQVLLEEYFDKVHWFSLVIYEPRFRPAFTSVKDGFAFASQKSFLLLLSTVLGMGAWYRSHRTDRDLRLTNEDWHGWSQTLLQGVESYLTDLMDQTSIASVQACILLGSYLVYHGKPNLSFALLGATIRTAQAIGLHRQPISGTNASLEERKRVWWTIYTWDRFASVTYGRPLGINDKDCNVEHPMDTSESRSFASNTGSSADVSICYSTYQRELNKLYLIATPLIEVIFGMRATGSSGQYMGSQYMDQTAEVTSRVWRWHQQLPPHLQLDLGSDCGSNPSHTTSVHRLQALSLQLTFDSLLIIFYRPLLAQQVDHLIRNRSLPDAVHTSTDSPSAFSDTTHSPTLTNSVTSPLSRSQISSTEQWWDAAVRTSRITEMPQLAQLATDSHLVAFLAINLFNSAIVMAVLALSDPLSDRAQQVKRTITRIFRLQELLGKRTQLSVQSNDVLKDIIHMLLRREADAMLAPITAPGWSAGVNDPSTSDQQTGNLMSVGETLRLPMRLPMTIPPNRNARRQQDPADRAMRLNESLTSVQQAFSVGADSGYGTGYGEDPNSIQEQDLTGNAHQSSVPDWSQMLSQGSTDDLGLSWDDNNGLDMTGNGLYWFWDTVWNDPQPHT